MKKEKRPINVGDKIEWCEGLCRYGPHAVTAIFTDAYGSTVYEADDGSEINRKQVTKVIRKKKKKREPRVVWVNEYDGGKVVFFTNKDAADMQAGTGFIRCVKFVEVME